ncbi:Protein CBG26512 [Caenorhabditis briggsae]|uniref:Protein CBG26512 n=1 Tax=Caenorhabditis briggsae TaxID=6238 RepID=B6IIZ5_CAEBR|nr:Protein CBG26512 [Caenorhabditis briggsae]CAR99875.1 Protein CBG26512 [Caenorhabditis briggsae]
MLLLVRAAQSKKKEEEENEKMGEGPKRARGTKFDWVLRSRDDEDNFLMSMFLKRSRNWFKSCLGLKLKVVLNSGGSELQNEPKHD